MNTTNNDLQQRQGEKVDQLPATLASNPVDMTTLLLRARYFLGAGVSLSVVLEMMGAGLGGVGLAAVVAGVVAYAAKDIHGVLAPTVANARLLLAFMHSHGGTVEIDTTRKVNRKLSNRNWWLGIPNDIPYAPDETVPDDHEEDEQPKVIIKRGKTGYLNLSPDYQPHVNSVVGHCILCVGQRGAGKTGAAARLIEQLGQYKIPFLVFDYKLDYPTLPDVLEKCMNAGCPDWKLQQEYNEGGYWPLDTDNAFDAGWTILEKGARIIFQVKSYPNINEAAKVMLGILDGMVAWANNRPAGSRVPALVLLDEAQQFLPEGMNISSINQELSIRLLTAFEQLNSVGRSLGLTPAFFTQRPAQIKKSVIGGSEIFWLMKQSISQDLKVYEDTLGKENINRQAIQSFESGEALVYENGELLHTRFYERQSEHLSITPTLEDAEQFYKSKHFTSSLIDAKRVLNSHSQEPVNNDPYQNVSSSDTPSREFTREYVNAVVEPSEGRECPVNIHTIHEPIHEAFTPLFTAQESVEVIKAYGALMMKSGQPPSRNALLKWMHDNVNERWNTSKNNYAVFKAICDEYEF